MAFDAFKTKRQADELRAVKGAKRYLTKSQASLIDFHAQEAEKNVGTAWAKKLKDSTTCAGMSVRGLSESLGILDLYATLYNYASRKVHPSDLANHIAINQHTNVVEIMLSPEIKSIEAPICGVAILLMQCLMAMNRHFRLGIDKDIDILTSDLQKLPRVHKR